MSSIRLNLLTKTTWKLKTPGEILVFGQLVQVWLKGYGIQVSVKGNFQQIFVGGWAETKTGLSSSSDFLVIWKCVMLWNSTFYKMIIPFGIVIFWTVSSTRFGISLYHGKNLFYKKYYSKSLRIFFPHKSGCSILTLADALICFNTHHFSYTYLWVQF